MLHFCQTTTHPLIYNGETCFFLPGGFHRCGALMARLEGHPSPLDLKTTEPRLMVIVKRPEVIMINKFRCKGLIMYYCES